MGPTRISTRTHTHTLANDKIHNHYGPYSHQHTHTHTHTRWRMTKCKITMGPTRISTRTHKHTHTCWRMTKYKITMGPTRISTHTHTHTLANDKIQNYYGPYSHQHTHTHTHVGEWQNTKHGALTMGANVCVCVRVLMRVGSTTQCKTTWMRRWSALISCCELYDGITFDFVFFSFGALAMCTKIMWIHVFLYLLTMEHVYR